ncbi:hypothetical protein OAN24_00910 [Pseudodesulfovibrio sp.]|nr:hypothetical protein [Pseudodesulfovibrio sp.]
MVVDGLYAGSRINECGEKLCVFGELLNETIQLFFIRKRLQAGSGVPPCVFKKGSCRIEIAGHTQGIGSRSGSAKDFFQDNIWRELFDDKSELSTHQWFGMKLGQEFVALNVDPGHIFGNPFYECSSDLLAYTAASFERVGAAATTSTGAERIRSRPSDTHGFLCLI